MLGFFGMPGHFELLVVALIILLLFGNRLPGVMRSLGRGIVEFKAGLHGAPDDDDEDVDEAKSGKQDKISDDGASRRVRRHGSLRPILARAVQTIRPSPVCEDSTARGSP